MNVAYLTLIPHSGVEGVQSVEVKESDMPDIMFSVAHKMLSISASKNIPICGKIDSLYYRGTALAAVQVGIPARFFVARFDYQDADKAALIFNPSYSPSGRTVKRKNSLENCLTYPVQSYTVPRFRFIKARYQNVEGEWIEMRLKGRDAILFQQMTDIMDGRTIKTEAL